MAKGMASNENWQNIGDGEAGLGEMKAAG